MAAPAREPFLRTEDLTRTFGGIYAVCEVSIHCDRGERLAIIGPNGAGKSTCFNLLAGAQRPDSGEIWLDGERIDGLNAARVCQRGLARTFQIPKPFLNLSLLENVAAAAYLHHPDRAAAMRRGEEILERFGLREDPSRPASVLNVADRKRLELARAYATEPKILLLDEVGAGLTPSDLAGLTELVRSLNRDEQITIVFVEHVMSLVNDLAHRVVVLEQGQVLAEGTPAQIMADPAVVAAYLGEEHAVG